MGKKGQKDTTPKKIRNVSPLHFGDMSKKDQNNHIDKLDLRITNPLTKRLYTIKEAAIYLGRGVWGVRDLVWKGLLPVVKNEGNGKKLFLDIVDLNKFIDRNKSIYH